MKRVRNMNMVICRCSSCGKLAVSIPGTQHRKCGTDIGKLRNYSAGSLTRKDLKTNLKSTMKDGVLSPAAKDFLKKASKTEIAGADRLSALIAKDSRGMWEAASNNPIEISAEERESLPLDPFFQVSV